MPDVAEIDGWLEQAAATGDNAEVAKAVRRAYDAGMSLRMISYGLRRRRWEVRQLLRSTE